MNCNKCNRTIPDGSTYCGYCGARVDGKNTCPKCGSLNDEQFVFCTTCGARIDGKIKCTCGEYVDPSLNYCNHCGTAWHATPKVKEQKKKEPVCSKTNRSKTKQRVELIGGIAMMTGVMSALIFVFFLGLRATSSGVRESELIYHFFGAYYKELRSTQFEANTPWLTEFLYSQNLLVGILTTVVGGLTMLSVVGFAIPSLMIYFRNLAGRTQKRADRWAIATIVSYLAGAVRLGGIQYVNADFADFETLLVLNGATVAGIAVVGACMLALMILRIIKDAPEMFCKTNLCHTVASLCGVATAVVLLVLASTAAPDTTLKAEGDVKICHGFMGLNLLYGMLLSAFIEPYDDVTTVAYPGAT